MDQVGGIMPYIPKADRAELEPVLDMLRELVKQRGLSNGELNYLMTMLAHIYVDNHGMSYNIGSDAVKAFECAKLEFYRRKMAPYEDRAVERNGDL